MLRNYISKKIIEKMRKDTFLTRLRVGIQIGPCIFGRIIIWILAVLSSSVCQVEMNESETLRKEEQGKDKKIEYVMFLRTNNLRTLNENTAWMLGI